MRLIDPYAPQAIYKKIIQKYGGEYSFFERLKMGGVGSPKVTYRSGIPEFDAIHYSDDLEHSMTNFELLKNGLIIRINKKQNLAVAIEHFALLEEITLSYNNTPTSSKTDVAAQLTITFQNQNPILIEVGKQELKGIQQYFEKAVFAGVYRRG